MNARQLFVNVAAGAVSLAVLVGVVPGEVGVVAVALNVAGALLSVIR